MTTIPERIREEARLAYIASDAPIRAETPAILNAFSAALLAAEKRGRQEIVDDAKRILTYLRQNADVGDAVAAETARALAALVGERNKASGDPALHPLVRSTN